jgi:tRNA/rRNA methyltransferase
VTLQLVLVEPAGPLNVGSVARLCANFGVDGLRLVAPRCDPLGEEARRMAVHGVALLEEARRFATLAEALADCGRVVACTGRGAGEPLPLRPPAEALRWLLGPPSTPAGRDGEPPPAPAESAGVARGAPAALVFGREDRGLANDELLLAGQLLQIGTSASYPSLNLSHAVAVVLHEWQKLRDPAEPGPLPGGSRSEASPGQGGGWPEPCPRRELEEALADAEALLLEVGFLLPHTRRARMAKLRAVLQRAQVGAAEVALLRGMVCQLRWASRRRAKPESEH